MLNAILAEFYERDIRKLIEEINLFKDEDNLWRTTGTVKNSAGNLVLHLIGGTNFLIGTKLAKTGFVRNRDQEFIQKGVNRNELKLQLEMLSKMVKTVLNSFRQGKWRKNILWYLMIRKFQTVTCWCSCWPI